MIKHNSSLDTIWAIFASFGCYFCVYGFRKPFSVIEFNNIQFLNHSWKPLLVSSQLIGYMISKGFGIKFISEILPNQRSKSLYISISIAFISLFFYAILPNPFPLLFLFINGLSLGLVFGIIQSYLEGRFTSELLIATLASSFILADGFSKSVGFFLLNIGISEEWMPFCAGSFFLFPTLFFIWMLNKIKPPTKKENQIRSIRLPMSSKDRFEFLKLFFGGLFLISLIYLSVSILRGIRSDFSVEILNSIGINIHPEIFTQTEFIIMFLILILNSSVIFFKRNIDGFNFSLFCILIGFIFLISTKYFFNFNLHPFWLIVISGLGIYLPFLTITTSILERLIAISKIRANVGFLMYLVDFIGYFGYNIILFQMNFFNNQKYFINVFFETNFIVGILGAILTLFSFFIFNSTFKKINQTNSL